jgi:uncharacterized membrane protein
MIYFIAGLVLFFGLHLYSAVRTRGGAGDMKVRLGYGPFMGLYSIISIVGFVLICFGYGQTRGIGLLYLPPSWSVHVNMLLMIPAMILLVASQLPAGRIAKAVKHPMLLSVKIWALGHLIANGEINSVILFGSFLAYAVFDRIMVKRRGDNGPGPDKALSGISDVAAIVIGLGAYAAIVFWLHPILFGVAVVG